MFSIQCHIITAFIFEYCLAELTQFAKYKYISIKQTQIWRYIKDISGIPLYLFFLIKIYVSFNTIN